MIVHLLHDTVAHANITKPSPMSISLMLLLLILILTVFPRVKENPVGPRMRMLR